MRRRFAPLVPAFLLALLMQVLAPVGASIAMARGAQEAGAGFPICGHADTSGRRDPLDQHPAREGGCCVLCGLAHLAGPPTDAFDVATILPEFDRVAAPFRQGRASASPSRRTGVAGRPRAPPGPEA